MKIHKIAVLTLLFFYLETPVYSQTFIKELSSWKFLKGDNKQAAQTGFDDSSWVTVKIPHDWAIYGPFDKEIDKQTVKIEQNNEKEATEKTGRTGALPFIGTGWYRTAINLPELTSDKQALITFDGAMSNAEVYINGVKVGTHPYGYSYFYFD
ncbi:MAG: beta-galactosidase, partial [Bacteroidota bacterium]|nr:beta-galactosidase [Bacteroidota bacterium]